MSSFGPGWIRQCLTHVLPFQNPCPGISRVSRLGSRPPVPLWIRAFKQTHSHFLILYTRLCNLRKCISQYFSIPGSVYNCMWTYMGSDCGRSTVAFYISTLRIREEPSCTKVINQQYKETISAGTKTITSELLLFVSVPFLFV